MTNDEEVLEFLLVNFPSEVGQSEVSIVEGAFERYWLAEKRLAPVPDVILEVIELSLESPVDKGRCCGGEDFTLLRAPKNFSTGVFESEF